MPVNEPEYQRQYMSEYYARKSKIITCSDCGSSFKEYGIYVHRKSKKHLLCLKVKEDTIKKFCPKITPKSNTQETSD